MSVLELHWEEMFTEDVNHLYGILQRTNMQIKKN